MKVLGRLADQKWLQSSRTQRVMRALMADGQTVRFVGGCVRDALSERPVSDVDIATPDTPEKVITLLERAKIKTVPLGLEHGSVLAVVEKEGFHITTLRKDLATDGRHAKVSFTDDWEEDAKRRDFTMNALYADLDGTYYDPCGGLADLKAGYVRFIGDPKKRIREDYLRVLRFFRFASTYHKGALDPAAVAACKACVRQLKHLSAERVSYELTRLLMAPNPAEMLTIMGEEVPVIPTLLPTLEMNIPALLTLMAVERALEILSTVVRRFAALIGPNPAVGAEVGSQLRLPREDRKALKILMDTPHKPLKEYDGAEAWAYIYRYGPVRFVDWMVLTMAQGRLPSAKRLKELAQKGFALAETWDFPPLPISGEDLIQQGVLPGPQVGKVLREVENWWIRKKTTPDRDACLAHVATLIKR